MSLEKKLNPGHTALLIIDIQIDFASPEGLLAKLGRDLSLVEPMINTLEKVIGVAKKAGVLTLFTQQIYDRNKLNDLQKEQYDLDGKLITCDVNTDGYKFYRINPSKDKVFIKHNFNCFSNLDLVKTLKNNGIKTLVITGMDTIFCVETAMRNAFDLGYKIVIPKDLVAGNAKRMALHNKTLEMAKQFGVVIKSDDLIKFWGKRKFD